MGEDAGEAALAMRAAVATEEPRAGPPHAAKASGDLTGTRSARPMAVISVSGRHGAGHVGDAPRRRGGDPLMRGGFAASLAIMASQVHPFQGLCLLKQTGSDADRGNFAQDEGSFAQVRCKISSRARGGGVMPIHQ
jgi:hypothetical protein